MGHFWRQAGHDGDDRHHLGAQVLLCVFHYPCNHNSALGAIRFVMYFRHPGKLRKALPIRHSAGQPIEADIVAQDNQAEHDVEITFPSLSSTTD